uniref:RING-CH-type domain-containing protein n=1 Tax=Leersia perrieri TaxID=77586 RepID=A0A0D9WBL2_9ORYZ
MGLKAEDAQPPDGVGDGDVSEKTDGVNPGQPRLSSSSTDRDSGLSLCRVCHCVEPDLRGDSALGFLGILPPSRDAHHDVVATASKDHPDPASKDARNVLEFVSPHGEIFVCTTDLESGPLHHQDHLMDLGCSCKNELALAHYACALKWFISHGSTVCEICGNVATNVRPADFNKVLASLKEYEALRERTSTGELSYLHYGSDTGVDPDAVAAIRRQRLSEISSWFNPQNSHVALSQGQTEQTPASPSNNSAEHGTVVARVVHARWSLEGTGVFLAIGLGVIVLAWLLAPHVGKKAAVICLHMLLGGLCALTIIISLRFVFPRIQYGSMRCWAILFVFWFLVFGVWASRTHSIRSS